MDLGSIAIRCLVAYAFLLLMTRLKGKHVVAEGILRALERGRFSRALPYLSENSGTGNSIQELKQWISAVEQKSGKIQDVTGQGSSIGPETAEAQVRIRTAAGQRELRFHLVREHALWKIAQLPEEHSDHTGSATH